MFNKNKRNSNASKRVSSYDDGNASIIVKPKIKAPLRSSSLFNPYSQEIFQLQQEINNKNSIDEFEEIELVDDDTSSSSTLSSSEDDELNLSAAYGLSSRIINTSDSAISPRGNSTKKQNRLSRMLFGWSYNKKASSSSTSSSPSSSSSPIAIKKAPMYDDGREELLYCGIQVKELRTTLDPMILPLANQITQPQSLQRPDFAHLYH
ncbi:hypothetical protein K501DRAFT_278124 [Backusella circina FSU 941]|nr:hypothetical protein K501DRAFT_278124 [Backusella circina FSU 941]